FFFAEDFLAPFFAEDFLAVAFFADFLAVAFFAGIVHLLRARLTTPYASGVDALVRSSRPTPRTARRGAGHSSGTRSGRDSRRRSAWPLVTTLPSRGRRSLGRTLGSVRGLAMERNDARPLPEITLL